MEFQKLAKSRHAVKSFDGKKVPTVDIKQIISTASLAPSGINIQSWKFVIIESDEKRNAILELVNPSNHEQIKSAGALVLIMSDSDYEARLRLIVEKAGDEFNENMRAQILERYVPYVNSFDKDYLNSYMSWTTGFVAMNLLYAISDFGYKSNTVLGFDRSEKMNDFIGIDKRYRPEFLIPFGTSDDKGEASYRLGQDDILEII